MHIHLHDDTHSRHNGELLYRWSHSSLVHNMRIFMFGHTVNSTSNEPKMNCSICWTPQVFFIKAEQCHINHSICLSCYMKVSCSAGSHTKCCFCRRPLLDGRIYKVDTETMTIMPSHVRLTHDDINPKPVDNWHPAKILMTMLILLYICILVLLFEPADMSLPIRLCIVILISFQMALTALCS